MSLCSCVRVWSMFWGEPQSGAEPALLHNYGLDGTLKWFANLDNGQAPHSNSRRQLMGPLAVGAAAPASSLPA